MARLTARHAQRRFISDVLRVSTLTKVNGVRRTVGQKRKRKTQPSITSCSSGSGSEIEPSCTKAVGGQVSYGLASGSTKLSDLSAVVVNLARRPDRMQACADSIKTHCPWLPYQRLEAADGKKDVIEASEVATSWHTGMNCVYQKIRSQRKGWNDLENYVPRELKLSAGERGCSLSHIRAWRRCLEIGRPLLVLEDDAVLMPEFSQVLERALASLPTDAHLLYLGYSQAAPWRREFSSELVESEYVWTTVGYVIWPSGAALLLAQLPVSQPVDNWMASHSAEGRLNAYAVRPKLVRQAEEWNVKSDVAHSDEDVGYTIGAVPGSVGGKIYLSNDTHHSVDLWWDAAINQKWAISKTANGLYTIQTVVSTSGGRVYLSHDTHCRIDLWSDAGANQMWRIQQVAENTFTLQAAAYTSSGKTYLGRNASGDVELVSHPEGHHWVIPEFDLLTE